MEWISIKKKKPKIGQTVLVVEGNVTAHHPQLDASDFHVAIYGKHSSDGRKCVFADNKAVMAQAVNPWIYDVTHWMSIPKMDE